MLFMDKKTLYRTRKRKRLPVQLLNDDDARRVRERFVQTFLMTYDEYYRKKGDSSSYILRDEYKSASMFHYMKEYTMLYYKEVLKLVRKMGDEVYFMSESELYKNCEGIKLNCEEKKGFVALCEPNALADQIIYEWRLSYGAKEMGCTENTEFVLPFELYIFDKSFTKYVFLTDDIAFFVRPYLFEERICYVYGFDKKLTKKYASKVKTTI